MRRSAPLPPLLAAALALIPGAAFGQSDAALPARPNVLFVVVDDLNADLGTYGHKMVKSPNVDRLATWGRRFDRAHCQYPLCNPSRSSVLSGLRPDTTKVYGNNTDPRDMMPNATFLPQLFRQNGYHTAYVGKVYHKGFEDPKSWSEALPVTYRDDVRGDVGDSTGRNATDWPDEWHFDGAAARAAADYLRRPRTKPFFLAVGFHKPHMPAVCPKKYWDLYNINDIRLPKVPEGGLVDTPPDALHASQNDPPDTIHARKESILAYYACISFMDAQLGIVLDALEQTGQRKNTIVVFWSDHGYHLDDHGGLWGKASLFGRVTRVPFIIAAPGMARPGTASDSMVELLDIYPTLADLSGLTPPARLQGKSLRPIVMKDATATVKTAAWTVANAGKSRAVNTKRWRYAEWSSPSVNELYNLEQDPQEYFNKADKAGLGSVVEMMRTLLRQGR